MIENEIHLSKSKYCRAKQCKKILWLDKYKEEEKIIKASENILNNGTKVGELARRLFGDYINISYNADLSKMVQDTQKEIKNNANIITEASFNYNNNFCSVDILKNNPEGLEIYEVKSSTEISDIYLDDASYQYYILSSLGYNVKKVSIVYINNQYIRHGKLELNKLFNVEDITEIAKDKYDEIKENIDQINIYMNKYKENNEPQELIGMQCVNPYQCEYWEYCIKDLPKPNVFDIKGGMHNDKKFEKYYEGKISFKELQYENLNSKYLEQIDFEINNKEPKIEKEPIKELLDSLKYPLYFIDFETFQLAIPEYEGTKPYQQLPFQYSLHIIEKEGAPIQHKEFLAEIEDKDFLRHFAESMIKDIPQNGSVIVYNMNFEHSRINELGEMFPDLKQELMRINNNMVDFLPPFKNRHYYMKEMEGSASIKKVLPALYPDDPELNYHNLPVVHNGEEASATFLSLKGKSKQEQEEIRKGLLVYCGLDTYAMVKIWEKLKEVVKEDSTYSNNENSTRNRGS